LEDSVAPRPPPVPTEREGRARDAAVLLPLLGLFLLMPPIIALFAQPVTVVGVPLIVAYVFGVWLALVAALLARALPADAPVPADDE
jgi:hypothetical protein